MSITQRRCDQRYDNEKRLVAEINSVVNQLTFPASWQEAMLSGDLESGKVVSNCVKGVLLLREKKRCVDDPAVLHPALSTMDAMETSKQVGDNSLSPLPRPNGA